MLDKFSRQPNNNQKHTKKNNTTKENNNKGNKPKRHTANSLSEDWIEVLKPPRLSPAKSSSCTKFHRDAHCARSDEHATILGHKVTRPLKNKRVHNNCLSCRSESHMQLRNPLPVREPDILNNLKERRHSSNSTSVPQIAINNTSVRPDAVRTIRSSYAK